MTISSYIPDTGLLSSPTKAEKNDKFHHAFRPVSVTSVAIF